MSAFISVGKTLANRVGNGGTHIQWLWWSCITVIFKEKPRAAAPRVRTWMLDVLSLSARAGHPQLHIEGHYSRAAVRKSLITRVNTHLRVQRCKNLRVWSTDMWKKVIRSDESSLIILFTSREVHVWCTPRDQRRPESLTPTMTVFSGSVMGAWFESPCPLIRKGHCKPLQSFSDWSPLFSDEWQYPQAKGMRSHSMVWRV